MTIKLEKAVLEFSTEGTTEFTRDLAKVEKAADQVQTSLADTAKAAKPVGDELTRLADRLKAGAIPAATRYLEILKRQEDVQALTSAEQKRANTVLQEAIAKYQALGRTVPPALQQMGTALKQTVAQQEAAARAVREQASAQTGFQSALSSTTRLLGAFGVSVSVGALVQFTKGVIDTAAEIGDVATKLDISVEAAQRFRWAARQSGADFEHIGGSIAFMNRALAGGDTSTVGALRDAGLAFDYVRALRPEQAFRAIADAIARIPDPMRQAQVAAELFGTRAGTELLPMIRDGALGAADGMAVMSEETVTGLKDAQQAWQDFGDVTTVVTAASIGQVLELVDLVGDLVFASKSLTALAFASLRPETFAALFQLSRMDEARAARLRTQPAKGAREPEHGSDVQEVGGFSSIFAPIVRSRVSKTAAERDADAKALADAAKALTALKASLSGADLQQEVQRLAQAVTALGGAAGIAPAKLQGLRKQLDDLAASGVKLPPILEQIRTQFAVRWGQAAPLGDVFASLAALPNDLAFVVDFGITDEQKWKQFTAFWEGVQAQPNEVDFTVDFGITDEQKWKNFTAFWDGVQAQVPTKAPSFLASAFDQVIADFPRKLSTALLAGQGPRQAFRALAADFGASIGSQLGTNLAKHVSKDGMLAKALPGLMGSAFSLVMVGIEKLVQVGQNTTKKMREEFAKSQGFGNLDKLYDELRGLGAAGQQLANIGLNVIGKKDTAAQLKWQQDVLDLLGRQKEEVDSLTPSWEELTEAYERYGVAVDARGKGTQQEQLAAQAKDAVLWFKKFMGAGGNFHGVLAGMSDELQGMVTQALRFGLEIPEAMRPMLDGLLEMGLLTDENGQRLQDLSRISFSRTLQESFQSLIDKLDEFIARLAFGLPNAAKYGLNQLTLAAQDVTAAPRMPVAYDLPAPLPALVPSFDTGTGGRYLAADTLAQLHADEAVVPRRDTGGIAGDIAAAIRPHLAAGGGETHVHLYLDGQQITETVVRRVEQNDSAGAPSSHRMRMRRAMGTA